MFISFAGVPGKKKSVLGEELMVMAKQCFIERQDKELEKKKKKICINHKENRKSELQNEGEW